jgi:hypothetical protein
MSKKDIRLGDSLMPFTNTTTRGDQDVRLVIGSLVTALSASTATADPVPILPEVFCFRITDIGRISGLDGTDGNDFVFEFEVLNWSDTPAAGVVIASTIGTSGFGSTSPTISGIGIDADGRGGPLGGTDIDASGLGLTSGSGTFDATAIHSGRGRGDIPGSLNDWSATAFIYGDIRNLGRGRRNDHPQS